MKQILSGSVVWKFFLQVYTWYQAGAIARFFRTLQESYPFSRTRELWDRFVEASFFPEGGSVYSRGVARIGRFFQKIGGLIEKSLIYRWCSAAAVPVQKFVGGGMVGRLCRFFGMRGFFLVALALYLPIDFFLRNTVQIGLLSSLWDEGLLLLAFCYVSWRKAMHRSPIGTRATPLDGYIFAFVGVSFFLMCVVSPYMGIAIDGLRAVIQYLFWFFIVIRLLEDDHDFAIFYGTLVAMAVLVGLHGIYQFIVATPIPAAWVSQTEQSVRTRVFSIMGSPNIMGAFLVLFAPMVAGIAYYSKKIGVRIAAMCCTGMMCLSIIFTFSKGAWGGLVVAIVVFAAFLDRRLIALMGVGGAGALLCIPTIANRITYMFTADYVEASQRAGRMVRWETGLDLLHQGNAWTGFGLGRFGGAVAMQNQILEKTDTFEYFYMDNYYLKTLVEMGYIGLLFFIILLVGMALWCLRAIGRTSRTDVHPLAVSMFAGMCGVLVHCYFENIFEVPYMMAYFWSLAAGILYLGYFRRKRYQNQKET